MKNKKKIKLKEFIIVITILITIVIGIGWMIFSKQPEIIVRTELPQEIYIGNAEVMLNGEIIRCGIDRKTDLQSLYCQGYRDGYEWGGRQASMFCNLEEVINEQYEKQKTKK